MVKAPQSVVTKLDEEIASLMDMAVDLSKDLAQGDGAKAIKTLKIRDPIHDARDKMGPDLRPKTLLSWSSGKDSAWALHLLRQRGEVDVVRLLTTVTETYDRVSMHGVRSSLLAAQSRAAGIPLWTVQIPSPCSNEMYEATMGRAMERARNTSIEFIAFGDLFLEDVRAYREAKLAQAGIKPLFPLWGLPTGALAREMIDLGLQAYVTCVDLKLVPEHLAGRLWDMSFLEDLPPAADPCGENGEFHTFVTGGPMFGEPISVRKGDIMERAGFVFADLLPD